jgi:hypothetical protein
MEDGLKTLDTLPGYANCRLPKNIGMPIKHRFPQETCMRILSIFIVMFGLLACSQLDETASQTTPGVLAAENDPVNLESYPDPIIQTQTSRGDIRGLIACRNACRATAKAEYDECMAGRLGQGNPTCTALRQQSFNECVSNTCTPP